ncbi:MAG: hypothetical protein LIP08_11260 [Bacteroides sp.]|nr:hypothetical protein [Bacteroides sp.]
MGMITYLDGKPGVYLPLEEKQQLRIGIDLVNNRVKIYTRREQIPCVIR